MYGYVRSSVLALCIEKETKLKFKSIFYRIWINVKSDKSVMGGRDYQVHFKYKYGSLGLRKFLFCLGNDIIGLCDHTFHEMIRMVQKCRQSIKIRRKGTRFILFPSMLRWKCGTNFVATKQALHTWQTVIRDVPNLPRLFIHPKVVN